MDVYITRVQERIYPSINVNIAATTKKIIKKLKDAGIGTMFYSETYHGRPKVPSAVQTAATTIIPLPWMEPWGG